MKRLVGFYIDLANEIYGINLTLPEIMFNLKGQVAGTANFWAWTLKFNPILLVENFDDMISQTVPHEVANLVARKKSMCPIKPHGNEWKSVMRAFGKQPLRCHSYDTTNAKTRVTEKYLYECTGCKKQLKVGKIRHNRIIKGAEYSTKCCRARIRIVEDGLIRV